MERKYMFGAVALLSVLLVSSLAMAYQGNPGVKGPEFEEERHEAMKNAFENLDYDAWADLMEGKGRVLEIVTEDNFAKFAEMHDAKISGDIETAKEIAEELGLGVGKGSGRRGMNRNGQGRMARGNGNCDC